MSGRPQQTGLRKPPFSSPWACPIPHTGDHSRNKDRIGDTLANFSRIIPDFRVWLPSACACRSGPVHWTLLNRTSGGEGPALKFVLRDCWATPLASLDKDRLGTMFKGGGTKDTRSVGLDMRRLNGQILGAVWLKIVNGPADRIPPSRWAYRTPGHQRLVIREDS